MASWLSSLLVGGIFFSNMESKDPKADLECPATCLGLFILHSVLFVLSQLFSVLLVLSLLVLLFSVLCPHGVFLTQQIVPEDLRPALTEQGQSNRRVHHRLDSPVRSEPPSASSRPAQVVLCCGHWETLFTHWYQLRLTGLLVPMSSDLLQSWYTDVILFQTALRLVGDQRGWLS